VSERRNDEPAKSAPEPWRDTVLRGMLTVAAIIAPVLSALSLFVRRSPRSTFDVAMMATAGLLVPVFRLAPGLTVRQRALATIIAAFTATVYMLARVGFAAGAAVSLVAIMLVGVVALGRRLGFVLIALSAIAHLVVGAMVVHGVVQLDARYVDPMIMQNWFRMAVTTTLLALLLALMIDSVIRHVEASSRATTEALTKLRGAYERLGLLHGRLEAAKEDERRFLAHELHDELGQTLTALKLRLQLGARAAAQATPGVGDAIALVDDLIARVRKMSVDLRPPLLDEDLCILGEQILALHSRTARACADQQRVLAIAKRGLGVIGSLHAGEQRECTVVELHHDALECLLRLLVRDLQQLEDYRLVGPEHVTVGDAEQQAVADLAGGAGDRDANWGFHRGASWQGQRANAKGGLNGPRDLTRS